MREYESREAAERDPDLDLRTVWRCDECGSEFEQEAIYGIINTRCKCGGTFREAGETYRG